MKNWNKNSSKLILWKWSYLKKILLIRYRVIYIKFLKNLNIHLMNSFLEKVKHLTALFSLLLMDKLKYFLIKIIKMLINKRKKKIDKLQILILLIELLLWVLLKWWKQIKNKADQKRLLKDYQRLKLLGNTHFLQEM